VVVGWMLSQQGTHATKTTVAHRQFADVATNLIREEMKKIQETKSN